MDPKAVAKSLGVDESSVSRALPGLVHEGLLSAAFEISPAALSMLDYNHRLQVDLFLHPCKEEEYERVFPAAHDIMSLAGCIHGKLAEQQETMGIILEPVYVVLGSRVDAQFCFLAKNERISFDGIAAWLHGVLPSAHLTHRTLLLIK
jgi:hypothetical protein